MAFVNLQTTHSDETDNRKRIITCEQLKESGEIRRVYKKKLQENITGVTDEWNKLSGRTCTNVKTIYKTVLK